MGTISVSLAASQVEVGDGGAVAAVSVTNAGARSERVVLGAIRPVDVPGGARSADPSWAVVDRPLRDIGPGATEQYVVRIAPPPGTPAGGYAIRFIAHPADQAPEEYADLGQVLRLVVPATPEPPPPRRRRWPWVVGAVVLLAAIAVVVYLLTRPEPAPEPESDTGRAPVSIETDRIPVGPWPAGVAIEPLTGSVYVSSRDSGTVAVVDPVRRAVDLEIQVGDGPVGVAADRGLVFVANGGSGSVSVVDIASGGAFNEVSVGGPAHGLAVDPGAGVVWATVEQGWLGISIPEQGADLGVLEVGSAPRGIAWNPVDRSFYVANQGDGTVSVVDPGPRLVTATIPVGANPSGVAVDPESGRVYVANQLDDSVSVIDADAGAVVGTISVGVNPTAVAVDPRAGVVYVTTSDGALAVIDMASERVVDTVAVGGVPTALAVDPSSGVVYVVNSADATLSRLEAG